MIAPLLGITSTSARMGLAALTTLLITLLWGPWWIRQLYSWKVGQPIRKSEAPLLGELHKEKEKTPTMGGLLILSALLISLLLWMDLGSPYALILLITTLVLGGIGALDDLLKLKSKSSRGLSSKLKFTMQVGFSLALAAYLLLGELRGVTAQFYLPCLPGPLFTVTGFFTLLWALWIAFIVTGSSNAVNLTDGLDGLASGLVAFTAAGLSVVAFLSARGFPSLPPIEGAGEIAIFLAALVGACVGFLWYNGHPAQVFMGDTGSLALGGLLGVSALLLRQEVLFGIMAAVIVAEALSVILQVSYFRATGGRRIFRCSPLHHHFEYKGMPESRVTLRFWIVGLFTTLLGMVLVLC
ncbi:MAG: phospho-N-acetylmuramoyl-pentapeptide-transferase [Parachlamydiales bacterium]